MRVSCSVLNLFVVQAVSLSRSKHRCRLYQMPACASSSQFPDSRARAGTSSSSHHLTPGRRVSSIAITIAATTSIPAPPPPIHSHSPTIQARTPSDRRGNAALHFCIAFLHRISALPANQMPPHAARIVSLPGPSFRSRCSSPMYSRYASHAYTTEANIPTDFLPPFARIRTFNAAMKTNRILLSRARADRAIFPRLLFTDAAIYSRTSAEKWMILRRDFSASVFTRSNALLVMHRPLRNAQSI